MHSHRKGESAAIACDNVVPFSAKQKTMLNSAALKASCVFCRWLDDLENWFGHALIVADPILDCAKHHA
jgi:hypothetical protein